MALITRTRMPSLEAAGLIWQVAAGDTKAFEALYHCYASPCLALSRRILVDAQLASDDARHATAALAALSHAQRQTLLLCYFGGYTQSEVATVLGIPLGTVKTRCLQGLRAARRSLDSSQALAS